jgi:ATP-dependent helicase/nuclease subunit B
LQAGIYSFKSLNDGFLQVNFAEQRKSPETLISDEKLNDFLVVLKTYIQEMYNPDNAFLESADLKY